MSQRDIYINRRKFASLTVFLLLTVLLIRLFLRGGSFNLLRGSSAATVSSGAVGLAPPAHMSTIPSDSKSSSSSEAWLWTYKAIELDSTTKQYSLFHKHGSPALESPSADGKLRRRDPALTFDEVFSLWASDDEFNLFFNELMAKSAIEFPAFFWEVRPIEPARMKIDTFECVQKRADVLAQAETDFGPFSEHFNPVGQADCSVVAFYNINKDALLVVPCPLTRANDPPMYTSIAHFTRHAPTQQTIDYWRTVGERVLSVAAQQSATQLMYISTSGLGVYYLHCRIEHRPKYYSHGPYRSII